MDDVYTVSELTGEVADLLGGAFSSVTVRGQISNLRRQSSGHIYFSLRDEGAQLVCAMWRSYAGRLKFRPNDGEEVLASGHIDVYPPHGKYQLIVRSLEPLGVGALHVKFEELKKRLRADGLFDADRKRPLPLLAQRIAVVTSPTSAALRDFLRIQRRRMPGAHVTVFPVRVQGAEAAGEIVRALEFVPQVDEFDAIALLRGGGSLEDLWSFNEEVVARAVAASPVPVVCGVGHETDTTIADLSADARAATPSEAAELLFVESEEVALRLAELRARLARSIDGRLVRAGERVDALARSHALARPVELMRRVAQDVDEWERRATRSLEQRVAGARDQLTAAAAHLGAVSPLNVLARGYSITTRDGDRRPLRRAAEIAAGDTISTRLDDGSIVSVVQRTAPPEERS